MIEVGGEGQATVKGFEDFALRFSNFIGKEIGGGYFAKNGEKSISFITIGRYLNNSAKNVKALGLNLRGYDNGSRVGKYSPQVLYHTHLSQFGDSDRLNPSEAD